MHHINHAENHQHHNIIISIRFIVVVMISIVIIASSWQS